MPSKIPLKGYKMQLNPVTPQNQFFSLTIPERDMRELIRSGDETLSNVPKDPAAVKFVLNALASSLFSEIQNSKHLIYVMSQTNQPLLITLTYKVGLIGKKLSEYSSKDEKFVSLKTDYEELYEKMAKLRVVKSGILDLPLPALKSKRSIDADLIIRLREIYQTHELDVFAKEFPDTEQIQKNYNNFVQRVANEIDLRRPKPKRFEYNSIFDLFIKEEQERLFKLITYFPMDQGYYDIDLERIAKCPQITSIFASAKKVFDSLQNPSLLKNLVIFRGYKADDLSTLVNLESLGLWGRESGPLNFLPHPEKLKCLKIMDFINLPEPSFWAKCTSLEKIKLSDTDERRTFDLSPLLHPEKIKTLKIDHTVFPDLTPFNQLKKLSMKSIRNLEQLNTISNCKTLEKLTIGAWGLNEIRQFFVKIAPCERLKTLTLLYSLQNYPIQERDRFTITKAIAEDIRNKYPSLRKIKYSVEVIKFEDGAAEILLENNIVVATTKVKY